MDLAAILEWNDAGEQLARRIEAHPLARRSFRCAGRDVPLETKEGALLAAAALAVGVNRGMHEA
jgi:hypothetical protein